MGPYGDDAGCSTSSPRAGSRSSTCLPGGASDSFSCRPFGLLFSPAEEMEDNKRYYDPRDLWPLLVRAGFTPINVRCYRHKFGLNTFAACRKAEALGGQVSTFSEMYVPEARRILEVVDADAVLREASTGASLRCGSGVGGCSSSGWEALRGTPVML